MARPEAKLKELKPAELKHEVGARSDLVVTIKPASSEPRLIAYGDEFLFEKLPAGTRVIYPPPPLEALRRSRPGDSLCAVAPLRTRTRCSRNSIQTCA